MKKIIWVNKTKSNKIEIHLIWIFIAKEKKVFFFFEEFGWQKVSETVIETGRLCWDLCGWFFGRWDCVWGLQVSFLKTLICPYSTKNHSHLNRSSPKWFKFKLKKRQFTCESILVHLNKSDFICLSWILIKKTPFCRENMKICWKDTYLHFLIGLFRFLYFFLIFLTILLPLRKSFFLLILIRKWKIIFLLDFLVSFWLIFLLRVVGNALEIDLASFSGIIWIFERFLEWFIQKSRKRWFN